MLIIMNLFANSQVLDLNHIKFEIVSDNYDDLVFARHYLPTQYGDSSFFARDSLLLPVNGSDTRYPVIEFYYDGTFHLFTNPKTQTRISQNPKTGEYMQRVAQYSDTICGSYSFVDVLLSLEADWTNRQLFLRLKDGNTFVYNMLRESENVLLLKE